MRFVFPRTPLPVASMLVLSACAPTEPPMPPDTTEADLAAVDALHDAWQTAFNGGDAAALTALYTGDAAIMNQGQATVSGQAAIRTYYDDLFSQMDTRTEIRAEATEVDGSLGFDSGTYTGTMTPKAGSDGMSEEGRYLVIVRKDADGTWKVAREFSNSSTPPALPAAGN